MFHIQQCLVKKRKIAAACALTAEKSEPHQLQWGKQQCLVAVLFFYSKNIKPFSLSNCPLGKRQCLHLKSTGAGVVRTSSLSPKPRMSRSLGLLPSGHRQRLWGPPPAQPETLAGTCSLLMRPDLHAPCWPLAAVLRGACPSAPCSKSCP